MANIEALTAAVNKNSELVEKQIAATGSPTQEAVDALTTTVDASNSKMEAAQNPPAPAPAAAVPAEAQAAAPENTNPA